MVQDNNLTIIRHENLTGGGFNGSAEIKRSFERLIQTLRTRAATIAQTGLFVKQRESLVSTTTGLINPADRWLPVRFRTSKTVTGHL